MLSNVYTIKRDQIILLIRTSIVSVFLIVYDMLLERYNFNMDENKHYELLNAHGCVQFAL